MSRVLSFFAALMLSVSAWALEIAPDQLVQKITVEVLAAVRTDQQLAAGDKQKAIKLAEEKVLPYIDFEEATRLAVGRAWARASPEQKTSLVGEFRKMLVRTYANAVGAYRGQTLTVLPWRASKDTVSEETTVHTQYIRASGQRLPVDFTMRKTDAGWKVFDFVVEGVSLVITYRSEFDAIVKQEGIDGLIKRLMQKNAPPEVAASTKVDDDGKK
jgi:phospholipid transport system substrate-binding protein